MAKRRRRIHYRLCPLHRISWLMNGDDGMRSFFSFSGLHLLIIVHLNGPISFLSWSSGARDGKMLAVHVTIRLIYLLGLLSMKDRVRSSYIRGEGTDEAYAKESSGWTPWYTYYVCWLQDKCWLPALHRSHHSCTRISHITSFTFHFKLYFNRHVYMSPLTISFFVWEVFSLHAYPAI